MSVCVRRYWQTGGEESRSTKGIKTHWEFVGELTAMSTFFVLLFFCSLHHGRCPTRLLCTSTDTHLECARGDIFSPPLPLFQPSTPSYQLLHCIYTTLDFFFPFFFFSLLKLPSILIAITPDLKEAEAAGEHSHFLTPMLFVCAVITLAAVCNGVASWMRRARPQTCLLAAERRRRRRKT